MDLRLLLKCDKLNNYPFPNLVVCRTNVILVSGDKYFCRSSVYESYQLGSLLTHQHNPLPPSPNPCMEFLKLRTPSNKFYNIFHLLLIYLSSKSCY